MEEEEAAEDEEAPDEPPNNLSTRSPPKPGTLNAISSEPEIPSPLNLKGFGCLGFLQGPETQELEILGPKEGFCKGL